MNKEVKIILILIIVAILVGVGYFIYNGNIGEENKDKQDPVYTITDITSGELSNVEVPDLDRMIINDETLSTEVVDILRNKITDLSDSLKEDPVQFYKWIDLGINRKIAGDYDGAVSAWIYASALRPQNSISFNNLGDIYGYYLDKPQEAEKNFLKAIDNGPNEIYLYFKTAEFYRDVMKDTEKTRKIIEQGVERNPESTELKELLNSL